MNIKVIQEKFAQALVHTNKAINSKPNIPVLSNVLLKASNGVLELSSTNLEIGVHAKIGAEIEEEGEITVSAKILYEFVNSLKPGKLELKTDGQRFVVNSVDNNAEFFTIPSDEFPSIPIASGQPLATLNALDFADALGKTTFAASSDNARPVLTGLLFKITKRKLTLVGVDGFRLSQKVLDITEGPETDFKEIIPARSLQDVTKIIRDISSEKDEIELYSLPEKNQVIFKIGDVELATRLIEGEFPAYEDILPKGKQYGFSALKDELQDIVKIVSIFARNTIGNKTVFSFDAEAHKLTLKAEVVDMGKNEASVDVAKVLGDSIETSYNARFIQDMITSMTGEEIIYETNGVTSPGVFKDINDPTYLHVIMPMILE